MQVPYVVSGYLPATCRPVRLAQELPSRNDRHGIDRGLLDSPLSNAGAKGFEVRLVNAHHVKNVPGRKTDIKDCQWLQQLHTFGMLAGSFRPEAQMCVVRSYLRLRDTLSRIATVWCNACRRL